MQKLKINLLLVIFSVISGLYFPIFTLFLYLNDYTKITFKIFFYSSLMVGVFGASLSIFSLILSRRKGQKISGQILALMCYVSVVSVFGNLFLFWLELVLFLLSGILILKTNRTISYHKIEQTKEEKWKKNRKQKLEYFKSEKLRRQEYQKTSVHMSLVFLFIILSWFFIANEMTSNLISSNTSETFYFPILFSMFYLGYLLILQLFWYFGYHPRSQGKEISSSKGTISVPVMMKTNVAYKKLRKSISIAAKLIQVSFNLLKFLLLLYFVYLTGMFIKQLILSVFFAMMMVAVNPFLTWLYLKIFPIKIIAKEYGRPIFDINKQIEIE